MRNLPTMARLSLFLPLACLLWMAAGGDAHAAARVSRAASQTHALGAVSASLAGSNAPRYATAVDSVAAPTAVSSNAGAGLASHQGPAALSKPTAQDVLPLATTTLPDLSGSTNFDGSSLLMLVAKFGIVLVLLFVCLRVLKVVMPGGRQGGLNKNKPMVLHSESLGDKQRVSLLDLGDSIVVVGISSGGINPITTISGLEEVERLRRRYRPNESSASRHTAEPRTSFAATLSEVSETLTDAPASAGNSPAGGGRSGPSTAGVVRQHVVPVSDSVGDPEMGQALGRMRELRQRITRA